MRRGQRVKDKGLRSPDTWRRRSGSGPCPGANLQIIRNGRLHGQRRGLIERVADRCRSRWSRRQGSSPDGRSASSRQERYEEASLSASPLLPPPQNGPGVWMTCFCFKLCPPVMTAVPVFAPFGATRSNSAISPLPAARWMAPSTPPPPRIFVLAAFTMASTSCSMTLPRTTSIIVLLICILTSQAVPGVGNSGCHDGWNSATTSIVPMMF